MSIPAVLFSIYFSIGLVLMIVAVASSGGGKRTKAFSACGNGDGVDAVLLIFIAVLWPIWIFTLFSNKDPDS